MVQFFLLIFTWNKKFVVFAMMIENNLYNSKLMDHCQRYWLKEKCPIISVICKNEVNIINKYLMNENWTNKTLVIIPFNCTFTARLRQKREREKRINKKVKCRKYKYMTWLKKKRFVANKAHLTNRWEWIVLGSNFHPFYLNI